jgi:hypothetical protein
VGGGRSARIDAGGAARKIVTINLTHYPTDRGLALPRGRL